MKKNKKGVIYSTNPNFQFEYDDYEKKTLSNNEQLLTLHIDKHRAGKTVIIIKGFIGSESDLKKLGKKIKKKMWSWRCLLYTTDAADDRIRV